MTNWKTIRQALSKVDNILSLLTVTAAILLLLWSLFDLPLDSHASTEIIIALLGLVALTSMIERESRLAQTSSKVDQIQSALAEVRQLLNHSQGTTLFPNDQLPHRDTLLDGATEILVAGAFGFSLLAQDPDRWKAWLKRGNHIKVIVQNPLNEGLRHLAIPSFSYGYENYKRKTEEVIDELKVISAAGPGMEIRLSDTCPTQGVVIVNGQNGGKRMVVALYIPGCGSANRPTMILSPERDQEVFSLFYEKYYVYLWNESKPLTNQRRATTST